MAFLSLVLTSLGSDFHESRESAESNTESRFFWTESVTPPPTTMSLWLCEERAREGGMDTVSSGGSSGSNILLSFAELGENAKMKIKLSVSVFVYVVGQGLSLQSQILGLSNNRVILAKKYI